MKLTAQKINFTARIKFCTPQEYERSKPPEYGRYYPNDWTDEFIRQKEYKKLHPDEASYPWNVQSIERVRNIVTGKIFTCTSGGITRLNNPSDAVRFHFVPEEPNVKGLNDGQLLDRTLGERVSELNDPNLGGFMVGGDANSDDSSRLSSELFKKIKEFMDQRGINCSYFWGQDTKNDRSGMDAYYRGDDDTWYILKFKKGTDEAMSSVSDLAGNFAQLFLSDNDSLVFSGRKEEIRAAEFFAKLAAGLGRRRG